MTTNGDFAEGWIGRAYLAAVWRRYRDGLSLQGGGPAEAGAPLVGNPAGPVAGGRVLPIETLRHAAHARAIARLLEPTRQPVIVEIGGGFGGQALQVMQLLAAEGKTNSRYVLFDLPEVAIVCAYFLIAALPKARVRLFGEGPPPGRGDEGFDIGIFPHFTIGELPDDSADLVFNANSFSEMDGTSARTYLTTIERVCRRWFFHINHDVGLRYREADGSIRGNLIGAELVPDPSRFLRVSKVPRALVRPEDRGFPSFEYVYARRDAPRA